MEWMRRVSDTDHLYTAEKQAGTLRDVEFLKGKKRAWEGEVVLAANSDGELALGLGEAEPPRSKYF